MTKRWDRSDLAALAAADEIDAAPLRPNGTLCRPTTIWVVRVDDNLYVRSYRGTSGSWYRAAVRTHRGRVRAGQVERAVTFVEPSDAGTVAGAVDRAYRAKYGRSSYVDAMTTSAAAGTTLRLVPR